MHQSAIPFSVFEKQTLARPERSGLKFGLLLSVCFLLAHIPLALLLKRIPGLGFAHAALVFTVGLGWAVTLGRSPKVAYAAAYIAGAEVLWRMSGTTGALPYEFGKYAVAAILATAILRSGHLHFPVAPLAYFVLLIPSALLTLFEADWKKARDLISFNLSGPFALMISVLFFSGLRLTGQQLFKTLMVSIGPIAGIAAICYASTFGASSITFGRTSNIAASGGFGPNQVAAILGFGILAAFLCLTAEKTRRELKVLFLIAMVVFGMQSSLTFSRTGLYLGAIGVVCASFYLIRNPRLLMQLLLMGALLVCVISYVVLPRLESLTQGGLSNRFKEVHTSGRGDIMVADLKIWAENPVLGIGVGQARKERGKFYDEHSAHTEFTRLVAEHGLFGGLAFLAFLTIPIAALIRPNTLWGKAVAASLVGFSILFMMASGMRLVLPAFTLGLATIALRSFRSHHELERDHLEAKRP